MIEFLQKQSDEAVKKVTKLYQLLNTIIVVTDGTFENSEIRVDESGAFGVIVNNTMVGSIIHNLNDMTISCSMVSNGNIIARCTRSVNDNVPFSSEFANIEDKALKKKAYDWFFAVSEAVYTEPEAEPNTETETKTTDAGTEVEEVAVEE